MDFHFSLEELTMCAILSSISCLIFETLFLFTKGAQESVIPSMTMMEYLIIFMGGAGIAFSILAMIMAYNMYMR